MTTASTSVPPGTPPPSPPPGGPTHPGPTHPPSKYAAVFDLLVAEIGASLRHLLAQGVDGRAVLAARLAALGGEGGSGFALPVTPRFSMGAYPDGSPIPPGTPPTPPPAD